MSTRPRSSSKKLKQSLAQLSNSGLTADQESFLESVQRAFRSRPGAPAHVTLMEIIQNLLENKNAVTENRTEILLAYIENSNIAPESAEELSAYVRALMDLKNALYLMTDHPYTKRLIRAKEKAERVYRDLRNHLTQPENERKRK